MKYFNLYTKIFAAVFLATAILSCKKGFLDLKPLDSLSPDVVWASAGLATSYVENLYDGLGTGGFSDNRVLSTTSDETVYLHGDGALSTSNAAAVTPDNLGATSGAWEWASMYERIRDCNLAISGLRTSPIEDANLKIKLKGEAHFLRAFYYHQLLKFYGGILIIKTPFQLNDNFALTRNTYEECVNFIVADCDTSITNLKGNAVEKGRVSSLAALALKARVLLFAASDLTDIATAKQKSSIINSYPNPELIGYVNGTRAARWKLAKDAAKEVLDATTGYKLDLTVPVTAAEAKANYISLSMAGGSNSAGVDAAGSKDILFAKYFTPAVEGGWSNATFFHLFSGPNGYHNWSNNSPIGQLVDDYEMMDNSGNAVPFDWANPQHKLTPFKNRDPRLYASILYDGAAWKPRGDLPAETQYGAYDLLQKNASGSYEKIIFNGLDSRKSSIEDWNGSPTGYNIRRFTDPNPAIQGQNEKQYIPWVFLRYTEMIFNYAEACNALGQDLEAVNWINKIRFRAGMPPLGLTASSGVALTNAIRHEKRVEMAFEEQRYFDIRRWMIAPQVIKDATVISITGKFKPGKELKDRYTYNDSIYDYAYSSSSNTVDLTRKTWADKMYYSPIKRSEIQKNSGLKNNPGYE